MIHDLDDLIAKRSVIRLRPAKPRWRTALENVLAYGLLTALSFGFWYLVFLTAVTW